MYYMHHFYIHKFGMLSLVQWVGSGSVLLGVCETGRGFLTMEHGILCLIYKCEMILKIRILAKSLFFILNCSIHAHEPAKKPVKKNRKQQLKQLTPKLQHWQNPFFSYWITVFMHMKQQHPVKKITNNWSPHKPNCFKIPGWSKWIYLLFHKTFIFIFWSYALKFIQILSFLSWGVN